jgi:carboxypeptidase Taq
MDAEDAYDDLADRVRRLTTVGDAAELLSWDQQVMMPDEGTPARSKQLASLSAVRHDLLTADELGALLDELDGNVSDERAAVVREVKREHERAVRVPTDLVEEISSLSSEALPAWKEARADDDFDTFAPVLEQLVEKKRRYAEHIDDSRDPYEVLFEEYEPCLPLDHAERVLSNLRDALVPLVDEVRASDADLATEAFARRGPYDTGSQEALVRDALSFLGYPWERGRLDEAPHPFSMGTQFDARVTTRYRDSDPLDGLTAAIHEFGHATYTLGLPEDGYGTPLGEPRDLSVHESQSRFWENHVGRTRAFWEAFLPTFAKHFPQATDVTPAAAYEAANQVYEDNPIRVEADELTYHLHILLRYEIERDLIRGDLDVGEVPTVWNDKMESYLGFRPDSDAEGCLQDIHWSQGSFGYFPTYTLGSVMAAQLHEAASEDVDVAAQVRAGDVDPIRSWLRDHVHRHGQRYETNELVREATGEDFAADAFLDYVSDKYGDLYAL